MNTKHLVKEYVAEKQRDKTYTIRIRNTREILRVNVRGCNVSRVITKLYANDYFESILGP